ncbi:MAG: type IX secretion system membrane protein PorP/SprF [Crocinitomicaceae bacterium]|nr:type IX secretion system membrane protein PorP/SprF [Crocinitomicaceae bacterium]MBT5402921.1 type IX secretion system membrane protein PorP/SprF [Crocinitomicaceae bacterium]MBT6030410.1 type IX secretion system membrane protein PorP/SprF [Crocinitomicaceae bacterium]MBT6514623.1 type IX secretion system membrane protein PorP/SprF [Crocinitomicaceae bacterium]
MKRKIAILMLFLCNHSYGQQIPVFSLYDVNKYILNPAFAGSEYYWEFALQHRSQWIGFANGPSTQLFSTHSRIDGTSSGFGANFYNDKTGVIGNTGANLSYAYHADLSDIFEISFGLNGSFTQYKLFGDDLLLHSATDKLLEQTKGKAGIINASFGTVLYADNFYFGLSALNLLSPKLIYYNGASTPLTTHYYLQTGGSIQVGTNSSLSPSLIFNYVSNNPSQVNLRLSYEYIDVFRIAAGYRWKDAFIFCARMKIIDELYLDYAYDMGISQLNSAHTGSHEVLLSYHFYYNTIYKNSKAKYNFKRIKKRAD